MATPVAGPSQMPIPTTDLKRRAEGEGEGARRSKHHRPPLPPPHVLATLVPDSPAFADLMKIEQKLDWTLLRKRAEINDALGRPTRVKRTLRVFVSNTAHDQPWQTEYVQGEEESTPGPSTSTPMSPSITASVPQDAGGAATGTSAMAVEDVNMADISAPPQPSGGIPKEALLGKDVDVNTGKGIAGWVLRIEGRLLDSGNNRLDKQKQKFSTFIKTAFVEFDHREPPTYPEGNMVEWHPQPLQPALDGFEVLRRGDVDVNCRIILHIAQQPDRFRVLPALAGLIAMKEGTRAEVMAAVWKLVKIVGAQDKEDGTVIRPVGGLERIFPPNQEGIAFHQLPELVARHLAHPDPITIPYTIRVDKEHHFNFKCYDIPIEIEDPLKSKTSHILQAFSEEGREIVKLEDKVGELAHFARDLTQKRDFLESFATNPQAFIQNWLAAQARDLDQMLGYQIGTAGANGGSLREEDLRRSDIFNMPWVEEAITIHEAARMEAERRGTR
ncbi:SWI/SNF-related matrix-associated actin-dependent regulator of chromatin subfamily D, partial [Tremellales sp. Uapishka_1]